MRGYSFGYYDLLQFVTSKYPKDTSKYMASTGAAALILNMKKVSTFFIITLVFEKTEIRTKRET